MRRLAALLFALAVAAPDLFAGGFGLANDVAHRSSELLQTAKEADLYANTGDNAAQSLPPCGNSTPYTISPADLSVVAGVVPLGNVNPSGHTLPTDHIYYYMKPLDPLNPTGPRQTATLVAPGDVLVTAINSTEYLSAPTPHVDYEIDFYACRDVRSYLSHVSALDPALAAAVGPMSQGCFDYSTGGSTFRRCTKNTAVHVAAGTVIGSSGPPYTVSFDFGSYDSRVTKSFAAPQRHVGQSLHTVCPIDYFVPSVKAQIEAVMGRFDGGAVRVQAPVCGDIAYDVAGTARGDWYKIGAPDSPEDPHLALIPDNVYPQRQNISSGTSVPGFMGFITSAPASSGLVDRDFSQVTPDGNVYCYDTFVDPLGQPAFTGYRILITMPTSTTLQIEKSGVASCGSGPWTMSAPTTFQR